MRAKKKVNPHLLILICFQGFHDKTYAFITPSIRKIIYNDIIRQTNYTATLRPPNGIDK